LFLCMYVCIFFFFFFGWAFLVPGKSMMDERVLQLKSFGLMLKK
jgi:hypothetical protein